MLVTGATGFLGSNLVLGLLQGGYADRVYCLVRPKGNAQERLLEALRQSAEAAGLHNACDLSRVVAISGNICAPGWGLGRQTIKALTDAKILELWHSAASLRYEEKHRAEIERTNVSGTEHAIEIAQRLGIPSFNHISTAFVAGTRRGEIHEGPYDPTYPASNVYEETKRIAEDLVLAARSSKLGVRIFRPSIVVGSTRTSDATSAAGFYGLIVNLHKFARFIARSSPDYLGKNPIRLLCEENTRLDLVPIDGLVREVLAIARTAGTEGTHIHVTNPFAISLEHLLRAVEATLPGLALERVGTSDELLFADRLFYERIRSCAPYLMHDKSFVRSRDHGVPPRALEIDDALLRSMALYFSARLSKRCPASAPSEIDTTTVANAAE